MVCATPSFIEKDSIFWYICRITMWSIIYTRLYWKGFGLLIHLPYYLANYVIYHIHRIILKRIRSFDTFAVLLGKLCDLSYTQDYIEKDSVFWYICHITWQTMWSIIYTGGREERTKEKNFFDIMIKMLYSFLCIFFIRRETTDIFTKTMMNTITVIHGGEWDGKTTETSQVKR